MVCSLFNWLVSQSVNLGLISKIRQIHNTQPHYVLFFYVAVLQETYMGVRKLVNVFLSY